MYSLIIHQNKNWINEQEVKKKMFFYEWVNKQCSLLIHQNKNWINQNNQPKNNPKKKIEMNK